MAHGDLHADAGHARDLLVGAALGDELQELCLSLSYSYSEHGRAEGIELVISEAHPRPKDDVA